jgi:hypothetical protein
MRMKNAAREARSRVPFIELSSICFVIQEIQRHLA